jgi:hypothetical protein
VIGEETDVDPDGDYVSHLDLYLRAMEDVGASTLQFGTFCSLAQVGIPVEVALARSRVPSQGCSTLSSWTGESEMQHADANCRRVAA